MNVLTLPCSNTRHTHEQTHLHISRVHGESLFYSHSHPVTTCLNIQSRNVVTCQSLSLRIMSTIHVSIQLFVEGVSPLYLMRGTWLSHHFLTQHHACSITQTRSPGKKFTSFWRVFPRDAIMHMPVPQERDTKQNLHSTISAIIHLNNLKHLSRILFYAAQAPEKLLV